jgi:hypothetical protein
MDGYSEGNQALEDGGRSCPESDVFLLALDDVGEGVKEICEIDLNQPVDFLLGLCSNVVILDRQGRENNPLDVVHIYNYDLKRLHL